jgi:DNA mismatch repair protein MutS
MMKQYLSLKEKYREEILFFRMGDFYEMFFDDAKVASEILGIALTSRNKDRDAVPMAGVPIRAIGSYVPRLLKAGKRVAICEQLQDPREAQGLVDRDVVRVISPGTVIDENVLGQNANNFIAGLFLLPRGQAIAAYGIAWVDVSTGEFLVWEGGRASTAVAELARISPAECVLPESVARALDGHPELRQAIAATFKSPLADWCFDRGEAYRTLTEHFRTRTLEGFGCEHLDAGIRAAGGLLHYLRETQKNSLAHVSRLRLFSEHAHMLVDPTTRRALELTETFRTGQRAGSLIDAIDRTVTALGARRLRDWILKPLVSRAEILYRQDGVEALVEDASALDQLSELLRQVHDLERICSRIGYASATARDLAALSSSLEVLPAIRAVIAPKEARLFQERLRPLEGLDGQAAEIRSALVDAPPLSTREGGLIRAGFDPELDELRDLSSAGTKWIASFQEEEARRVGIASLKVGFNRVFGYYIEVTHTHAAKVPPHYIRKQTLKNAERYITPELKDFETRVLHARETAMELEHRLFCRLRDRAALRIPDIQSAARAVAELDAIAAFARLAVQRGYCRPDVVESKDLIIEDGRHPVIEALLPSGEFVPNSIALDEPRPIMVITGPNMAGKSTYIRQVAIATLLAQTGSFIPARSATIGIVDRIFTRIGAADDISRGQSTFMVEMQETANILNNASPRSLLVLDEVGRGTSTFDGLSLAWSILEHIAQRLEARTLFATHYQELTELSRVEPRVRNVTFQVKEWNEEIIFLRKVIEGATDKSYGIHVARLAGIPQQVIRRAQALLTRLEAQSLDIRGQPRIAVSPLAVDPSSETAADVDAAPAASQASRSAGRTSRAPAPVQLDFFRDANEALWREIDALDLDRMTPLEALNFLADLRRRLV